MNTHFELSQLTVDGYLANPFDPFGVQLDTICTKDIDDQAFKNREIPVGLAIALFMISRKGDSGLTTNKTGLRRFYRYHASKTVSDINSLTLGADEVRVREEASRALDLAEKSIAEAPTEFQRERRRQEVQKRRRADGDGAWRNYRDALASLYKFIGGIVHVQSPTRAIKFSAKSSNQRCALTEEQMMDVWQAAALEADAELALLYLDCLRETAARVHAVRHLNLEDINWTTGFATFRTKNRRIHRACLSIEMMQRIRERAERQGWNGDIPDDYDPRSFKAVGTPAFRTDDLRRIGKRWNEGFFLRVDERIGILEQPKITAHWLRHTTITQVERLVGKDAARRWAGHKVGSEASAADQTETYIKWTDEERVAIFNYMFPATPTGPWSDPRPQLHVVSGAMSA